ncbi:Thioredoxin [Paramicrosporidium saccamoebae]|uniref:Thioredoxin n=1 Tax=Paramicrosporidium saccamoebae TaxID=1246581 RepID=A0A2H9TL29_9FUNG|nr:Thioredoxin [Paramicrosporidium saccamoebae]
MVQSVTSLSALQELISSGKPVAIDFYAVWCGPCKAISPKFEQWAAKYTGVTFIKVDVDQAAEIAGAMQITAMPTFMFFKDGKKVETVVGADPSKVEAAIAQIA